MEKVILDTDMVDGFDDGVALLMLEKANNIELLGISIVAGNTSIERATASAIRQLEIINSKTPIYIGSGEPLLESRYRKEHFKREEELGLKINYAGYLKKYINSPLLKTKNINSIEDYKEVYEATYNKECTYNNVFHENNKDKEGNSSAIDFMISQVNKYPNEITIIAIGPLTNIAKAIEKDKTFSSKVKRIVYMGGAFYCSGNATKTSEFNWWVDPHAAKICINSKWGNQKTKEGNNFNNQIIFSLDVTQHTSSIPQIIYDKILNTTYKEFREILLKNTGEKAPKNIWDIFAAAYVIDTDILIAANNGKTLESKENGVYVDINTNLDKNFGKSFVTTKKDNSKVNKALIANYVDEDILFNKLLYPLLKK